MRKREEGRINMALVEAGVGRVTERRRCGCGSKSASQPAFHTQVHARALCCQPWDWVE